MAWNEPGNNDKDRDPWGSGNRGNGSNEGPPDLDEAFRKIQGQLGGLFGKNNAPNNKQNNSPYFFVSAIILAAILIYNSVFIVQQPERAVILRFGEFHSVLAPGLQFMIPLVDTRYIVNVSRVRSLTHQALMLTGDDNIVDITIQVQYLIYNPQNYVLKVLNPEISLRHATESALRHAVGSGEMSPVLTDGREQIAIEVQQRIQNYIDDYGTGIEVTKVNIENAQPPAEVQAAFDDVTKAVEDEQRVINEAETYKNGIIPEARGLAQRTIEEARAYKERVVARAEGEAKRFTQLLTEYKKAPEVTRNRLYLDSMQSVLSNSTKVLMDVQSGNNMLYLPLDQLASQGAAAVNQQRRNSNRSTLSEQEKNDIVNKVLEGLSQQTVSSSRRGRGRQ